MRKRKNILILFLFILLIFVSSGTTNAKAEETEDNVIYEYIAKYGFDAKTLRIDIYSPNILNQILAFNKGDILESSSSDKSQIGWFSRLKGTNRSGYIFSFMVQEKNEANLLNNELNDVDEGLRTYEGLFGIRRFVAMENIDASTLDGFLSYSEGDVVVIIQETSVPLFMFARSELTGHRGLIDTTKMARTLTTALYDLDPAVLDLDQFMGFEKGERLYIKNFHGDNYNDENWIAESKETRMKGKIPGFMVSKGNIDSAEEQIARTNIKRIQKKINSGVGERIKKKGSSGFISHFEKDETIVAMESLDFNSVEGFLSYREGDVMIISKKLHTDFWYVKSTETEQTGLIHKSKFAKYLTVALYDFDPNLFKLEHYLGFEKGDHIFVISGTKYHEDWFARSQKTINKRVKYLVSWFLKRFLKSKIIQILLLILTKI